MATHREVLQWLENELFKGNLMLGQRLPTDRDLAAVFGVSRTSMRETLKDLESQGIIRLFDGPRRSILPMLVREPAASAGPAMKLHMATSQHPLRDVVEMRVHLQTWALSHAQEAHVPLEELRGIIAQMDREDIGLKKFHDLYVSFHMVLVRSAGNGACDALFAALRDSIYEYTMTLVSHVPLWSTTSSRLRAEHRAIVGALEAGDMELASRLVAEHIRYQYEEAGLDLDRRHAPDGAGSQGPDGAEPGTVTRGPGAEPPPDSSQRASA